MQWSKTDTDNLINNLKDRFMVSAKSLKSQATSKRESKLSTLVSRIENQIEEVNSVIPIQECTPEKWDELFYFFGGGQSRRKSSAILSRDTWQKFISICEEILYK